MYRNGSRKRWSQSFPVQMLPASLICESRSEYFFHDTAGCPVMYTFARGNSGSEALGQPRPGSACAKYIEDGLKSAPVDGTGALWTPGRGKQRLHAAPNFLRNPPLITSHRQR